MEKINLHWLIDESLNQAQESRDNKKQIDI